MAHDASTFDIVTLACYATSVFLSGGCVYLLTKRDHRKARLEDEKKRDWEDFRLRLITNERRWLYVDWYLKQLRGKRGLPEYEGDDK